MVALKKRRENKAGKAEKLVYAPRPVKEGVDYAALRKNVMKRYPKVRAHLAK